MGSDDGKDRSSLLIFFAYLIPTDEKSLELFGISKYYSYICNKIMKAMNMEHTGHISDTCKEPALASVANTLEYEEPEIPCNVDFGFPRSIAELKTELHESLAERKDASKWMTSNEFWTEMHRDLAWL